MVRRTDHLDLQQVEDIENSFALLFAHQDYRDYWEREGHGAYLALRIPGLTTLSAHLRDDEVRPLASRGDPWSLFRRDGPASTRCRDLPAVWPTTRATPNALPTMSDAGAGKPQSRQSPRTCIWTGIP